MTYLNSRAVVPLPATYVASRPVLMLSVGGLSASTYTRASNTTLTRTVSPLKYVPFASGDVTYRTDGADMLILNRFITSKEVVAEAATYVRPPGRANAATSSYSKGNPGTSWPLAWGPGTSVPSSCTRISWTPSSLRSPEDTIAYVSPSRTKVSAPAALRSFNVALSGIESVPDREPSSCTRISWTAWWSVEVARAYVLPLRRVKDARS